jgi:hypothetical protein
VYLKRINNGQIFGFLNKLVLVPFLNSLLAIFCFAPKICEHGVPQIDSKLIKSLKMSQIYSKKSWSIFYSLNFQLSGDSFHLFFMMICDFCKCTFKLNFLTLVPIYKVDKFFFFRLTVTVHLNLKITIQFAYAFRIHQL